LRLDVRFRRVLLIAAALMLPPIGAWAQVSTINGSAVDQSQSLIPGVTIVATHLDTGKNYTAVTNERGEYELLNVAPGRYRLEADLSGFAKVVMPDVEVLVGRNVTVQIPLKVAAVAETVTVSGQAPLVDTQSAAVAGNIDTLQMKELPLQGRNWLELSMFVKGITANNVTNSPGAVSQDQYQVNLDGQQVSQRIGTEGFGQTKISRDAIAEYQIVTNLFDVTQGRSVGMQVQAISRTGTNDLHGSGFGFFRDDRLNAKDKIANRVLPYSNQQVGGSIGGPLVRDKLHFFGSYEYEREPATAISQPTFLPGQFFTFADRNLQHSYLARVDDQLSKNDHLSIRFTRHTLDQPFTGVSGTVHPSRALDNLISSGNVLGSWTRVFSNDTVGELRGGFNRFYFAQLPIVQGVAEYVFPGLTIGQPFNQPLEFWQNNYQARYDLTSVRGRHDFKIGGEFIRGLEAGEWHVLEFGRYTFTANPPDLSARFPADAWNTPSRWNLAGLDPLVQTFQRNFHTGGWLVDLPRPQIALWFGDRWRIGSRLTVNYGVRWDDDFGVGAPPGITENTILINNGRESGDFGFKKNIRDHNNVAPRAGFVYDLRGNARTVIRGGSGIYYSSPAGNVSYGHQQTNQMVTAEIRNDGLPGFIQNPLRGVAEADIFAGRFLPPQAPIILASDLPMPYAWQSAIGVQKQLGAVTGFDVDLVHYKWYNDERTYDPNLFFDPATGYNVLPTVRRPNPAYGTITWSEDTGHREYLGLSSALNRRLSNNIQGGITHTYMFFQRDDGSRSLNGTTANNNFDRFAGEWARSTAFQRHTLRTYAIYQLPLDFTVSGAYFYGSGTYHVTSHSSRPFGLPGTNRLNLGPPVTIPEAVRDQFEGPAVIGTGQVVPRNALRGLPLHKVDLRLTKTIDLPRAASVSLIGEVFNVFDRANYTNYVNTVNTPTFGQPRTAQVPRSGQLAVQLRF
jgi:hypothetical protein